MTAIPIPLPSVGASFDQANLVGMGVSTSSAEAVLNVTRELIQAGIAPSVEVVAKLALRRERSRARAAIAGNDVFPIVHGGVVRTITHPNSLSVSGEEIDGEVSVQPLKHDPLWIANHLLLAWNPIGERHRAPDVLRTVFENPRRSAAFVDAVSALADYCADSIEVPDARRLGHGCNSYRVIFNHWTDGAYVVGSVQGIADELAGVLGPSLLGWKLPGAGGCEALMLVTAGEHCVHPCQAFFHSIGWACMPVRASTGLCVESADDTGKWRVSVPCRLDIIGAADLGADRKIGRTGTCVAIAIDPRRHDEVRPMSPQLRARMLLNDDRAK